jgi:hypothetical protein
VHLEAAARAMLKGCPQKVVADEVKSRLPSPAPTPKQAPISPPDSRPSSSSSENKDSSDDEAPAAPNRKPPPPRTRKSHPTLNDLRTAPAIKLTPSKTSLNVHDYDAKWDDEIKDYIAKTEPASKIEDVICGIEARIVAERKSPEKDQLRQNLFTLMSTRTENADKTNLANAEKILCLLWDKLKDNKDLDGLLFEQLADLSGGFCSQGRTTRFSQILCALIHPNA